jgi:hypothetical protein
VWADCRADRDGIYPLHGEHGQSMTFYDWYTAWLTDPTQAMKTK